MQGSDDTGTPSVDQTPTATGEDEATAIAGPSTVGAQEEETPAVHLLQEAEDGSDAAGDGLYLYGKLQDALTEAENLRHQAYEETRRRQMAERDLAEASKKADDAESSYRREAKQRKEAEEMLARERSEMERDRQQLHDMLHKIHEVNEQSAKLELQITNSERIMTDLEAKLSDSYGLLHTLRRDQHHRQAEAETATTSARTEENHQDGHGVSFFLRIRHSELDEATSHLDESARIDGGGHGGRGKVYRGHLRSMPVAVKVLGADVAVDEVRFTRAVDGISRVRHPNLLTLVGACPEARAVVYELVPGGSLEARLAGENEAPLPWHARCGIAYGACSALAFLHSARPRRTAHGDVRPANILLVDEQACKLGGLGTRGLVEDRGGGVAPLARATVAYADPQYLATGELSPRCDVYSLGVVLLRLVTGRPAFLARKAAQEAAGGVRSWHEVVDASAGGWPTERAREVALVGLKCCGAGGDGNRTVGAGELLEEARGVLEDAMRSAPSRSPSSEPSYFLCPIVREVMRDPQIAGDGFTYEAEAIREWLGSGHDTSPMTNLKLPTLELVPNHALRSAIHDWQRRSSHKRR